MDRPTVVLLLDLAFTLLLWHCKNLADRDPPVAWAQFFFPAEIRPAGEKSPVNTTQRFKSGLAFFLWGTLFLVVFALNWYGSAVGTDQDLQALLRAVMVVCALFGLLGLLASLWLLARAVFRS